MLREKVKQSNNQRIDNERRSDQSTGSDEKTRTKREILETFHFILFAAKSRNLLENLARSCHGSHPTLGDGNLGKNDQESLEGT